MKFKKNLKTKSILSTNLPDKKMQSKNNISLEDLVLNEIKNTPLNEIVSNDNISKKINIDIIDIYKELEKYESLGILEYNFLKYCKSCNTHGDIYRSLNQIENEFKCSNCLSKLDHFKDTILVFRKVKKI